MSVDVIISKLEKVKQTGNGRWVACCPAHEDRRPSLAVRELDDGRVLIHCFAGCDVDSVLSSLGLQMTDLFPNEPEVKAYQRTRRPFNAVDVLRCVAFEAVVASVAAGNLAKGQKLNAEDYTRLFVAAERLQSALEVATNA